MSDIKINNRAAEIKKMYADEEDTSNSSLGVEENSFQNTSPRPAKKSKGGKVVLTIIAVIILVLAVLAIISKTTNWDVLGINQKAVQPGTNEIAKSSDWQAVFLTNGQVYFGKLKNTSGDYPSMEDIYYLQVQNVPIQPAQAAEGTEGGVQPAEQAQQQLVLVKFGTELHRPMDKMYINKQHIMFFEDLSSASNVVQAIEDYKKNQQPQ